jgi:hypothetical protein
MLRCIDSRNLLETEFELIISGISMVAHAPLITVKLSCFYGDTCLFTS